MTERASFHARVMALPQCWVEGDGFCVNADRVDEIASEADALAEAAMGLRVALQRLRAACSVSHSPQSRADCWAQAAKAEAAYAKAAGESA